MCIENRFLNKSDFFWLVVCLLSTVVFLSPVVLNDWVLFDDPENILENNLVKNLKISTLQETIISGYALGAYIPVVIFSWAIDYFFWGNNAFGFHLTNLTIHLCNVYLVYKLILRLNVNLFVVLITTLLFAIHPMHVEAVSWISSRKDLLYTFFCCWHYFIT